MPINETVTLMRGETLVKINVTVIDDNIMEDLEVFEIRMELPQQDPLPFDVNLIDQTQEIQIQDNDGWLHGSDFLKRSRHCCIHH